MNKIATKMIQDFLIDNKSKIEELIKDNKFNLEDIINKNKFKDNPYIDLLKEKYGSTFSDLLTPKEKESETEKCKEPENSAYAYDSFNCRYAIIDVPGFEKSDIKITMTDKSDSLVKYINVVTNEKNTLAFSKAAINKNISLQKEEKIIETKLKNGVLIFKIELPTVEPIEIKID